MTLELNRIQAICFDVDGTLSDTDDQFVQRLSGWLHPLRHFFPGKDVRSFARWAVMRTESPASFAFGLPDRLHLDPALSQAGEWVYQRGLGRGHAPFLLIDGVAELLRNLQGRFPMAVVSARGERSTRRFLQQYDLERYFDPVVTALTCRHTKPYPDPILHAAQHMGVKAWECLMVGDTTVDIQAGKRAGAQTVGVLCGFGQEAELRRSGADLILPRTADLLSELP